MGFRRRTAVILAMALSATLLGGCAADTPKSDPQPTQEPQPTTSSEAPEEVIGSEGHTACLLGEWRLDLGDYRDQAAAWIRSLGTPLDELEISGLYSLIFTVEQVSIFASLSNDFVVYGHSGSNGTEFEGIGNWYWEGGEPSAISVHDWEFIAPPTVEDEDFEPPAVFDPSLPGAISVACAGDTLSIRGSDAPLTGNFVRHRP